MNTLPLTERIKMIGMMASLVDVLGAKTVIDTFIGKFYGSDIEFTTMLSAAILHEGWNHWVRGLPMMSQQNADPFNVAIKIDENLVIYHKLALLPSGIIELEKLMGSTGMLYAGDTALDKEEMDNDTRPIKEI